MRRPAHDRMGPGQPADAQLRQFDALSTVLQLGSRDQLAELLSDGELETLRSLGREGMGANSS